MCFMDKITLDLNFLFLKYYKLNFKNIEVRIEFYTKKKL